MLQPRTYEGRPLWGRAVYTALHGARLSSVPSGDQSAKPASVPRRSGLQRALQSVSSAQKCSGAGRLATPSGVSRAARSAVSCRSPASGHWASRSKYTRDQSRETGSLSRPPSGLGALALPKFSIKKQFLSSPGPKRARRVVGGAKPLHSHPPLLSELDTCLDRMAAPILPWREEPDINTLCPQSTFQELPVMGKEYASFRSLVTTSPRIWCETRAWRELSELQSCDWAIQLA